MLKTPVGSTFAITAGLIFLNMLLYLQSMEKLITKLTPKNLFLIDATGAFLTAITHGLVFVQLNEYIGLSTDKLYLLTFLVSFYFLYSVSNACFPAAAWRRNLRIIAFANIAYCPIAFSFLMLEFNEITLFAKIYFFYEFALITLLASFELKYARTKKLSAS